MAEGVEGVSVSASVPETKRFQAGVRSKALCVGRSLKHRNRSSTCPTNVLNTADQFDAPNCLALFSSFRRNRESFHHDAQVVVAIVLDRLCRRVFSFFGSEFPRAKLLNLPAVRHMKKRDTARQAGINRVDEHDLS